MAVAVSPEHQPLFVSCRLVHCHSGGGAEGASAPGPKTHRNSQVLKTVFLQVILELLQIQCYHCVGPSVTTFGGGGFKGGGR